MSTPPTLSQLPLFGRKYQLLVKFPPDDQGNQTVLDITDSDIEPRALRVTFDIYMPTWQNWWTADISIYNLNEVTALALLGDPTQGVSGVNQGMEVILSAGYGGSSSNYGVIWDGFVFQPLWDRENVTNFKLTLRCSIGLADLTRNFVAQTYSQINQLDLISQMAKDCFRPITIQKNAVTSKIKTQTLSRGRTVFGNPRRYFNWIAADNNVETWLGNKGITFTDPSTDFSVSAEDAVEYTPETGLIGTPVQTQDGANIRVLLNPNISAKKPLMQVRINNAVIRQLKRQRNERPGLLDQDGQYIVQAVRHIGDTRGNDWYTEVTGVSPEFFKKVGIAIGQ
jgi:hypothetical protein